MWIVGDWGQASPWSRNTGVKMVKGKNNVYTGKLSLPKGTKFDIKILKPTVSGTSGGHNTWSAVKYASTLNISASHDFGKFTDNLIPNGNFEEGAVKWTPSEGIVQREYAINGGYFIALGDNHPSSVTSDTFVIPPNQNLKASGYMYSWNLEGSLIVEVKDVDTQHVLLKTVLSAKSVKTWEAFSGTFKTGSSPVAAQVVCTNVGEYAHCLDFMSVVMT